MSDIVCKTHQKSALLKVAYFLAFINIGLYFAYILHKLYNHFNRDLLTYLQEHIVSLSVDFQSFINLFFFLSVSFCNGV